ncbi:protein translocase subunit SecF [Exiguobacterium acetylicum]|nr:protein translocase subunit SecF [Exiguobacterium acetylicum]UKS55215.1 protein translocase subunit SecF [Exiguobacterium acetylicum]
MSFNPTKFDYVKHRKVYFAITIALVIVSVLLLSFRGLNLGIDFTQGTRVEISSENQIKETDVRSVIEDAGIDAEEIDGIQFAQGGKLANVTFVGEFSQEQISEIKQSVEAEYKKEPSISTVSAQVGREIARNAIYAVLLASLGIVIYVSFRFQPLYGIATVLALLHDALMIIAFFSLFQIEVNLYFIAAVLTIIGYSVNDTIVTFDRVRENLGLAEKGGRKVSFDELAHIVNESIQQTIIRSINTVITVIMTAAALYIFGSEAIRGFSLALLVGLIMGMYSSIFIAAQLWLVMKGRTLGRTKRAS